MRRETGRREVDFAHGKARHGRLLRLRRTTRLATHFSMSRPIGGCFSAKNTNP